MFDKIPPKVFVQASTIHGLGVFAAQDIPDGQIIEKCPLLRLDIDEKDVLLANYRFWWMEAEKRLYYVMALGYGSLYNYSNNFNAYFHCNKETFTTTKDIKKGEEIFVDYGGEEYGSSINYIQVK